MIRKETSVGLFIIIALAIFFYMTFNIGVFRLNRNEFIPYIVFFNDISGLQKKADVKIAGVRVGWVEGTDLIQNHDTQAQAHIMVSRKYQLHTDAYAIVRQEGLLGTKYIEIIPGDPLQPSLGAGAMLGNSGKQPVNVDELMRKFQIIAANVEDITGSLKSVVDDKKEDIKDLVVNFNHAAQNLANFSTVLERAAVNNEQALTNILSDFREVAQDLRQGWPQIQHDFNRVSNAIENTALQAQDSIKSINDVAGGLNKGKGLLGKLMTDDGMFDDIKATVQGVKGYLKKVDQLGIVFDGHTESMWSIAEHFLDHMDQHVFKKDSKAYFGFRIHPNEDHFYIAQVVTSRKGTIDRSTINERYSQFAGVIPDMCPGELFVDTAFTPSAVVFQQPLCQERTVQRRNTMKFSIQLAKAYKDIAFRFGLFENTGGVGIDYDVPFKNDNFRWVTTLEMFDFYGDDRINDQRPHMKWLNNMFFFKNFYLNFGADDFVSKHNANAFFGFGMRFTDDDMKHIMSKISALSGFGVMTTSWD